MSRYTYEEARLRLRNHAPHPPDEAFSSERESFCCMLGRAEREKVPPDVGPLAADVIACLEAVNRERNGPVPSENVGPRDDRVLREVVYAMTGIIAEGVRCHRRWCRTDGFRAEVLDALQDAVCWIAFAWDQVIAGDIDDLAREIEWAARAEP